MAQTENSNNNNNIQYCPEKQLCMAQLRERYLYTLSTLCGQSQCNITMREPNIKVTGEFKAFDSNFDNVIVENLVVPSQEPLSKAILRTEDIVCIELTSSKIPLISCLSILMK